MTVARAGQWVVAINPDGSNIGAAGGSTSITGNVTAVPLAGSSVTTNAAPVSAPGVGAALGSVTVAATGTYDISVTVNVGGTTGTVDFSNVSVLANAITTRIANGVGAAINVQWQQALTAAQTVAATAVAASTAGSVYGVTITITRVI
jgi:hypothetical protein